MNITTIKPGAQIWVAGWTGGESTGTVTGVYADIKNGRPGVDYTLTVSDKYPSRWCYLDQISDHVSAGVMRAAV